MRTLTSAMTAAANSLASAPDFKLELADIVPHYGTVTSGGAGGPCAACIAPDGSVVAAYVNTTTVKVIRVTDPTNAAQWTTWSTLTVDGRESAGVAILNNGASIRLFFQQGSASPIRYCDSLDSGVTWSAPATLFDPGKVCYGIACVDASFSPVFIAYDNAGLGAVRLAVWTFSGVWAGTDWTNGDLNTITGIAVVKDAGGNYQAIVAGQGISGQPYSILQATYSASHLWTGLSVVKGVDVAVGLIFRYPHLSVVSNQYRLTFLEQDNGSSSGIAYTRVVRTVSPDFFAWQATTPMVLASMPHGADWVAHSAGLVLVSGEAVAFAPVYNPATMYRDLSADVVSLSVHEREGKPAVLRVTLDNSAGTYTSLPALVGDAQILLSQGWVGVGLMPTHLFYVDGWTYQRSVDTSTVVVLASDASRMLGRQTRYPISYNNRAVASIISDLTALAGFESVAVVDSSPQFSQTVAQFQVPPGQTFLAALQRLLTGYEGALSVRVVAGSGPAFAAVDRQVVVGKSAGQAVIWSYDGEPEYFHLTRSSNRANHLIVYGPQSIPTAVAEAWDAADLAVSGRERYALVVEQLAGSAAAAASVATLAMARETRLATRVELAVAPNPGLEMFDAIAVNDTVLPVATGRITGLALTYQPRTVSYDLVITCEGI